MNKKIKNLFLAGAVIFSLAGVAVSCTDYDDDIDKLQDKTTTLETQVKDLTTKLTQAQTDITGLKTSVSELQGAVTTLQGAVKDLQDVSKTHATKEELEAAKTELTNKINSVKSELESNISALRSDLEKKIAAAEKNANTYTDNAVANALKEAKAYTDQLKAAVDKALEGKVDVTTFNETVKRIDEAAASLEKRVKAAEEDLVKVHAELDSLKNVTATNGNDIAANKEEIAKNKAELEALSAKLDAALAKLGGQLKGLVFNTQVYVDGVPAIDMATYAYKPLTGDKKDSKDETWTAGNTTNSLNGKLFAEYYLNPSNASVSASDDFSYILNQGGNTPFVVTRGKASSDFAVTPAFESVADGKVKVSIDVKGAPADSDYISIINLKVSTGDTSVVSNDHTLYRHEIKDVVIANKKDNTAKGTYKDIKDQHYRTLLGTADPDSYLANNEVWNESYDYATNVDTVVTKEAPLNLKGIVALHDKGNDAEYTDEQFANYGFSWKFELVKNYKINGVDQADFVELSDSVLTVNEKKGQAAFGRTPVVRVTLLDGENVVKVAYIKVGITGKDTYEVDPLLNGTKETNTFAFACAGADTLVATYAQMKSQVYDKVGMADSTFNKDYSVYVDADTTKGATSIVKVAEGADSVHVIRWIVPMDSIWNWSGKTIEKEVYYTNADSTLKVSVKLTAKVEEIAKTYGLKSNPDYIDEYWWGPDRKTTTGFDLTKFNVNVPNVGSVKPDSCVFKNDLNAAFVTKDGKTVIADNLSGLQFFFCKKDLDGKKFTFGDTTVTFTVPNDTTLMVGNDVIAQIFNNGTEVPYNYITLKKDSDVAKRLLNTDELYTYIGARAYYCGSKNREVAITFNGEDHFRGDFIRPVYIRTNSTKSFVDAVDYGEPGSYIDLADLINPYDWRDRDFAEYENYWQYYGPFEVTVDTKSITCDLNGVTGQAVPATIVLEQTDPTWQNLTSKYGFLSYKNNGNNVSSFNLYVPVTVKYGWGVIKTTEIKVPVKGTLE